MGWVILLAFVLVPIVEIGVFIEVGGALGLWPTLGLILLTAVLGSWQLRLQGLATLAKARSQMDQGVMPAHELFDGLCLLVAGALLLTPGFVTDAVGALLFLPPFRAMLRIWAARHVVSHTVYTAGPGGPGHPAGPRRRPDGDIIDGEYEDVSDAEDSHKDPYQDDPRKLEP